MSFIGEINWKFLIVPFVIVFVVFLVILIKRKKDTFCRCNSLGSRVICENEDKEKLNKMYVDGTLTENNF
jgi:hypothetical protein